MAEDRHKHPRDHEPEPGEPDTYDIVEPTEQEEPASRFDPRLVDHRIEDDEAPASDQDAEPAPPAPPPSGADYDMDGSGRPRPRLLEGIPEPKFVDPEVKAMRREEERLKGVQEQLAYEARRRRLKLLIAGGLLCVGGLVALWLWRG